MFLITQTYTPKQSKPQLLYFGGFTPIPVFGDSPSFVQKRSEAKEYPSKEAAMKDVRMIGGKNLDVIEV